MADRHASLGVVVVHYQTPGSLQRCVASVLQDPSRAARRVVVVDNSDTPGSTLVSGDLPPGVILLFSPDNPGFGAGANRGVQRLKELERLAAYVILNADVELLPGYLDAALDALRNGVGAAAGPIYLDEPGGPLWYAGGGLSLLTGTVKQSKDPAAARQSREVAFIPGTAMALAAGAWEDVGGFSPDIFLYHEDLDLCMRMRRAGWKLWFAPAMKIVHHLGQATGSSERSSFYLEHMAKTRLRPYRSRLYKMYLAVIHGTYVLSRALAYTVRGGPGDRERARSLLRGHRAAVREIWHK
ncbi:MAG TPA: glycosyltransferase family 2 protein [Thermoanaerobaculia bacterium]|nr:glycosyltransferase family 2 protein [Thermoanaerobaculia bacterium]